MSEQTQTRELSRARGRTQGERAEVERYVRSQRQARRRTTGASDRARPLEFDESGFPIVQERASFVDRVARLLHQS
jgi:hypothetical protein